MKTFLLTLSFSIFAIFAMSQNILTDGSLEGHNTNNCDYNNNESAFNSHYTNLTSIPLGPIEIDIIKHSSGCYGDPAPVGSTKLLLANKEYNSSTTNQDAFSFDLTTSIISGNTYEVKWYMQPMTFFGAIDGEIQIGISSSANTFGTQVFSGTSTLGGSFTLITGTFVATSNASYLTVRAHADVPTTGTWIGVDGFELKDLGGTVDCDVVTATVDTIIMPLDSTDTNAFTFAAEDWITLTGEVASGSAGDTVVDVTAGQYIELNPTFESKIGTNATYRIEACTPPTPFAPLDENVQKRMKTENTIINDDNQNMNMTPPHKDVKTEDWKVDKQK